MPPPMMSVSTFFNQVVDDADLIGNLSAAEVATNGRFRVLERAAHDGNLLLDEVAADSREVICNACCGSMCTVCGAEWHR